MIQLHIFVEELSMKRVLDVVVPKLLPENTTLKVYPHQGKEDLKKSLHKVLPSISKIPGARIIISMDQDSSDCAYIKSKLNEIVSERVACDYKIRIVCRELESWFLGDLTALENAFGRFKPILIMGRAEMRDVDNIAKPSDYILRVIPEYIKTQRLPKVENAERIAPFLSLDGNTSKSFNNMISAIRYLVSR